MNIEYTNRSNYYHFIAGIVLAVVVLTPIGLGEVKLDLADLDLKLQKNLLKGLSGEN
jgi:hypothetical protein